jgi:hypothetical protein
MKTYRLQRTEKNNKTEYNIKALNGQEFIRITGGWRVLAKLVILSKTFVWILAIILGIAILHDIYPDSSIQFPINISNLNFLLEPIWVFFVFPSLLIPNVIILTAIGLLFDLYLFKVETSDGRTLGEIRGQIPLLGRTN